MIKTVLAFLALAVVGDLVSLEAQSRLKRFPELLLRIASLLLAEPERSSRLKEWRGELAVISQQQEDAPLSRFWLGMRYAIGICLNIDSIRSLLGARASVLLQLFRAAGAGALLLFAARSIQIALFDSSYHEPLYALGLAVIAVGSALDIYRIAAGMAVKFLGLHLFFWAAGVHGGLWGDLTLAYIALSGAAALAAVGGTIFEKHQADAAGVIALLPAVTVAIGLELAISSPEHAILGQAMIAVCLLPMLYFLRIALGSHSWPGSRSTQVLRSRS